jgi:ribonuclease P protein subunit RPR2
MLQKRLQVEQSDTAAVGSLAWRRSGNTKEIARERIQILLGLAKDAFSKDRLLAKRYVEIARYVGMKAGVRIPKEEKIFLCKSCGSLLVPGVNCRVRTRTEFGTTVLITCLECGTKKRYPTVRERLSKRNA